MSIASVAFYGFEILAAFAAAGILFTRNVFYGALLLVVCLLSLAGIFILATAEFVAVTQILIYAGGVLVLIIFGVMLTSKFSGKPLVVQNQYRIRGPLVGLSFFSIMCLLFSQSQYFTNTAVKAEEGYTTMNQIGILLMSDYVLPFETAGILLLIALLGAAVVASSFNSIKKP
jgi:NADH:ubiquinone oxidoreductase subunit 6 (subunit J)